MTRLKPNSFLFLSKANINNTYQRIIVGCGKRTFWQNALTINAIIYHIPISFIRINGRGNPTCITPVFLINANSKVAFKLLLLLSAHPHNDTYQLLFLAPG